MGTRLGGFDTDIQNKKTQTGGFDEPVVKEALPVPEKQYADVPDIDPSSGAAIGSSTRVEVPKEKQYEKYPTIAEYDIPGLLSGSDMPFGSQMALKFGIPFSSNPQQLVDILKKNVPGVKFTTDVYGNPMADIQGKKYHLDRPGLSSLDVSRGIIKSTAALPAALAAGYAAPVEAAGVPLALGAQALAGTGQNLLEQGITKVSGSEQQLSPVEAVTQGVVQAGFPVLAKGMSSFAQLMAPDIFATLPRGVQTFFSNYADKLRFKDVNPSNLDTDFMLDDPRMRQIAHEIMLQDSPASDVIESAINNRNAASQKRIFGALDENLGRQSTTEHEYDTILKQSQGLLSDQLGPVLEAAPPIDPSGVVSNIDKQLVTAKGPIKSALEKIRTFFVNKPGSPATGPQRVPVTDANGKVIRYETKPGSPPTSPEYETSAQGIQNALNAVDSLIKYGDNTIGVARNSLPGKNAVFTQIRQGTRKLLQPIDGYSDIMGSKANLYEMSDAHVAGNNIFSKGEDAVRPYQVQNFMSDADTADAFKRGIRSAFENKLRESKNDLSALKSALGDPEDYVRKNLEFAYGKDAIDKLAASVEREGGYQQTGNELLASRKSAIRKIGPQTTEETEKPVIGDIGSIPQKAVATPINWIDRMLRGQSGPEFDLGRAKFLTARGPEIQGYKSGFQKALDRQAALRPLQTIAPSLAGRIPGYVESLQESSGGRVGRKSGGRTGVMTAEALLRDLKRRRVMLASKTEHMLSLPDDAIVQALDAAKR